MSVTKEKKKFYNIGRQKFDKFEKDIEFVDMKMVNRDKFNKLFTSVNKNFCQVSFKKSFIT